MAKQMDRDASTSDKVILRKLVRTIIRRGQDSDVWPVVLLLFAVLVPAVCLLWFMSAAMRNERLAARQKLAEAYRAQLAVSQARLQQYWSEMVGELDKSEAAAAAPANWPIGITSAPGASRCRAGCRVSRMASIYQRWVGNR